MVELRHFSHSEQSERLELENGADQNVYFSLSYDVPQDRSTETKHQGISPRSWSLLGLCYLETRALSFYFKCIPFGKDNPFAWEPGHMCESNPSTAPFALPGLFQSPSWVTEGDLQRQMATFSMRKILNGPQFSRL